MAPRFLLLCAAVALAAFATGFFVGRGPSHRVHLDLRHTPEGGGTPVATFADDRVTAEELERRFAEMSPTARSRYQTLEQKREYLEGLVRFELLSLEARVRGLASDADVRETTKKVMVQRLLAKELDEQSKPPTDEELQAYFEKHRTDYVRPEMIRLSHVFLAAPRGDPIVEANAKKRAEAILAEAKQAAPMDFRTFGALAVKHSEESRTRTLEGDMRYLSRDELAAQYGPEVAAASDALKEPGAIAPLVQTDRGFHVLKLRLREAAVTQDVQSAKSALVARISHERRTERYDAFLAALRTKWRLKIDDKALDRVAVDPRAPARPNSGPPPGFIPPPSRAAAAAPPRAPPAPGPSAPNVVPSSPAPSRP